MNINAAASRRLAHVPEERQRPLHDTADVLAPRLIAEEETGRRIHHVVERGLVETFYRGLFLIEVFGVEPRVDLFLDSGNVRPPKPGGVAGGADRDVDGRVHAVRARMPGVEHAPAALPGRRLQRAALADRSPIGR